jgi:hypothetical protein
MHLGVGMQEVGRHADHLVPGRGDLQMGQYFGSQHFVDENAAVLRVILKLDDVTVAVVGFQ